MSINKPNGVFSKFFTTIIYAIALLNPRNTSMIITNTNIYKRFVGKLEKYLRKTNAIPIIVYDVFNQAMDLVKTCGYNIMDAIRILSLGTLYGTKAGTAFINKLVKYPLDHLLLKANYTSEESADNFATMYGYGADLSTALLKLGTKDGNTSSFLMGKFDKIPILSTIMHFNEMPVFILLGIIDAHPHNVNRVKDQIEMLKSELKKEDLDPKMVKYIKSDIELCEEALNALVDCSSGIKDPYIGMKFYNKIVSHCSNIKGKILGGGKRKFEEYDKAFKHASKNKEDYINGRN